MEVRVRGLFRQVAEGADRPARVTKSTAETQRALGFLSFVISTRSEPRERDCAILGVPASSAVKMVCITSVILSVYLSIPILVSEPFRIGQCDHAESSSRRLDRCRIQDHARFFQSDPAALARAGFSLYCSSGAGG